MHISCFLNNIPNDYDESIFDFCNDEVSLKVSRFHNSLPDYKSTPTVSLSKLARLLAVKEVFIKDESQRFDLNAFKILGASYAMTKVLGEHLNLEEDELSFERIKDQHERYKDFTFVTATDGNHGRAVAWMAEKFGCKAVVYMPKGSSTTRLKAIQGFGAKASITEYNYDDTVLHANKMAKEHHWILLQDTAWEGYEEIPTFIMQGYFTLLTEFILDQPNSWPTHVFVQAGVGSLATAILAFFCKYDKNPMPVFVVVEPTGAPCLYESMKSNHGKPYKVEGDLPTIMAGLACGEPSSIGLEVLKARANAFIECSDDVAKRGMRVLGKPLEGDQKIISGESGAATIGVVYEILTNKDFVDIKNDLNLNKDSSLLLFSTEGDTDPEAYRSIVSGE